MKIRVVLAISAVVGPVIGQAFAAGPAAAPAPATNKSTSVVAAFHERTRRIASLQKPN